MTKEEFNILWSDMKDMHDVYLKVLFYFENKIEDTCLASFLDVIKKNKLGAKYPVLAGMVGDIDEADAFRAEAITNADIVYTIASNGFLTTTLDLREEGVKKVNKELVRDYFEWYKKIKPTRYARTIGAEEVYVAIAREIEPLLKEGVN